MATDLTTFDFEGSVLRVSDRNGAPWFVAADVCKVLGLSNPAMSVQALDDDERSKLNLGRQGEALVVNESGLWTLILRSREATTPGSAPHRLRKWVTSEVLPSIRRTGSYGGSLPKLPSQREVASTFRAYAGIAKLIGLDRNQAAIAANQATLKSTGVNALEMLGTTHLTAPEQERLLTPTEIGQRLGGKSARVVNLELVQISLQTNEPGGWTPTEAGKRYARLQDTGKKHGSGTPVTQLKWLESVVELLRKP